MTPYYDADGITIYHGDCADILPSLLSVDLVVTSPPYNLSGDGYSPNGTYFRNLGNGYGAHDDAMLHQEYVEWQHTILRECWNLLSRTGAIFYNHKPRVRGNNVRLPLELIPKEASLRQVIVWDRGSGFNRQFTYFVPAHEWILLLAKPDFRTNTRSIDDVWRVPFDTDNPHPAPFPLAIPRLAIGSTDAEIVLDPFMGSGTTLVAAKELGRQAIGIEIEERFCEMAVNRLAQGVLALVETDKEGPLANQGTQRVPSPLRDPSIGPLL